jgi:hypothetical protein
VRKSNYRGTSKLFNLPVKALLQFLVAATASALIAGEVLGCQPEYGLFVIAFALIGAGFYGATSELRDMMKGRRLAHSPVPTNNERRTRR